MQNTKKLPSKKYKGFTLVELIVVITILVILGTIGFVQLQGFVGSARDSARVSDMTNISKGLEILLIKNGTIPIPDSNSITITASGIIIGIQGYAGVNVLSLIKMSDAKDPVNQKYYTYFTNANNTNYQILALLENSNSISAKFPLISKAYADDYSLRYPIFKGDSRGIILSTSGATKNTPLQIFTGAINLELNTLDTNNFGGGYGKSCSDILSKSSIYQNKDGIYTLNPTGTGAFQSYCDMTNYGGGWILVAKNYGKPAILNLDICLSTKSICNGGINNNLKSFLLDNKTEILSMNSKKEKIISFTVKNINSTFMKALKGEQGNSYSSLNLNADISNIEYNTSYNSSLWSYLQSYYDFSSKGLLICAGPGGCGEGALFSIGWGNYSGYYVPYSSTGTTVSNNDTYGEVYIR